VPTHLSAFFKKASQLFPWLGAVLSGFLLFAAFPPLEWSDSVWIALVPLFISAASVEPRRALRLSYVAGLVFWVPSVFWVMYVTVPGWIGLALYCAIYVVPFAAVVSWWVRRWGVESWSRNIVLMLIATATWVGFEYLRSVLFTGFAWNTLGTALYKNLPLLQSARWGGVYAVTAIIVWANAAVALTLMRFVRTRAGMARRAHPEIMLGLLAVVVALVQGLRSINRPESPTTPLRVAIVQARTPQMDYYMPEKFASINQRLGELSHAALRVGEPDLIVWSETAIPDELRSSFDSYELVYEIVTNGVPLLVGSMDTEWTDDGPRFYNSSFLVDTNGVVVKGYDKRHLVIFGEYVPLKNVFPFLSLVTPIQESFSPGRTSTVFRLESPPAAFSVLICFEDTVASLARESVRNGARLLINQTNDGWFDAVTEPRQHMMQCVLRCVENNVPAVRAANTGVSCYIDRRGRVYDVLDDGEGNTFVSGFRTSTVHVPDDDMALTFYTRHGDLFAQLCAALGLAAAGAAWTTSRGKREGKEAGADI